MTRRTSKATLFACMLTMLPGCFEMTQTITLNPDGRGKVTIEKLAPATFDLAMGMMMGPGGGDKKPSLDEVRKNAAKNLLSDAQGVTAFKDVSATWLRDGRLKIVGTVYFNRLEDRSKMLDDFAKDLKKDPTDIDPTKVAGMFTNMSFLSPALQVSTLKDGSMRINVKKSDEKAGEKKASQDIADALMPLNLFRDKGDPVDILKMTDKELDELLLEMRVAYAMMKPMMEGMFGSLKVKTVLNLPGEVGDIKGFKKDGQRSVSIGLDGSEIVSMMQKVMMMDAADARKLAKVKDAKDLTALFGSIADLDDASVTARNVGAAQFDYDKEVSEARAAYPALRKSLDLPAEFKLPGGK